MTWKLTTGLVMIPIGIAGVLAALAALSFTPAAGESGQAFSDFVNTASNPEAVGVDTPSIGSGSNPIGGVIEFANLARNWLTFLANAVSLNYPAIFEGDLVFVRYGLLLLYSPFLFLVAREMWNGFSNFIGGVF